MRKQRLKSDEMPKCNNFRLPYNKELKKLAQELRSSGNLSEVIFWNKVKNGQFRGYRFNRQKIIGNYIVDFYCADCRVVIEIDGFSHKLKGTADSERDLFLRSLGLEIIRIDVKDIFNDIDEVIQRLYYHTALLEPIK